jgi:NADPH-dependent 2,4-dienoyl-CoA reductase/sulfur reductase-like enzyme
VAEALEAAVVVVGAGPAGLAAAVHAAEAGASVLLLDAVPRLGGQVWRHRGSPPRPARRLEARLSGANARRLFGATVVDAPGEGDLLLEHEGRGQRVRYGRLVLATGARERFLPFPGWTLPGVLGVGGAQALVKEGARFDGLRVVAAGTGPLLLAAAAALRGAGAQVVAVAEQAPLLRLLRFGRALLRRPRRIVEAAGYAARLLGTSYRTGRWVRAAEGQGRVEKVTLTDGRRDWTLSCDVVACAFGLVPNLELGRLLGCAAEGEALLVDEAQRTSVPGVFAAGEVAGVGGTGHAVVTGALAGLAAAGRPLPPSLMGERRRERAFAASLADAFALRDELRAVARPDTIVCRCEDVTLGRLLPYSTMQEAKLQTRTGMGPCQSRVCGPALAFLRGFEADSVRPPISPVPLSVLAAGNDGSREEKT